MANDTRNPIDVTAREIAREITVTPPESSLGAQGVGTVSTGSFPLTFRDENGDAKKWFRWGKTSVFDPDAIVY